MMYTLITCRQRASTKSLTAARQMVFLRGKKDSSDGSGKDSPFRWEIHAMLFSPYTSYNSDPLLYSFSSLLGSKKKEKAPSSFASYLGDEATSKFDKGSRGSASSATPHFDNFTHAVVEAARASNGSGENRFR